MKNKQILGRKALIEFVDLEIKDVVAKIDTGAFHNAIHCKNVEIIKSNKNSGKLTFTLLDEEHPKYDNKKIIINNFRRIRIKNSSGIYQKRYLVSLEVIVQGKKYHEQFSLADRSKMLSPVLLGRKFLKGRYIVDVAKLYVNEG
ncbi:MAG: RimK/LysX family protein [bacterium]|nr:RimK/LysX family protein [bacterium]